MCTYDLNKCILCLSKDIFVGKCFCIKKIQVYNVIKVY